MYLLAADAESAYIAAGVRGAAAGAVASEHGRSVRTAGGLRNSTAGSGAGGAAAGRRRPRQRRKRWGRPPVGKGPGGGGGPSVNGRGAAAGPA